MKASWQRTISFIFLSLIQCTTLLPRSYQADSFTQRTVTYDKHGFPATIQIIVYHVAAPIENGMVCLFDIDWCVATSKLQIQYPNNVAQQSLETTSKTNQPSQTTQSSAHPTAFGLPIANFSHIANGSILPDSPACRDLYPEQYKPVQQKNPELFYVACNVSTSQDSTPKSGTLVKSQLPTLKPEFIFSKPLFTSQQPFIPQSVYQPRSSIWANPATRTPGFIYSMGPSKHSSSSALASMNNRQINDWLNALIARKVYCQFRYGMTVAEVEDLFSRHTFKGFKQDLLSRNTLSEDAIWELWQEYKSQAYDPWRNADQCETDIQETLHQRLAIKQQAARAQLDQLLEQERIKIQKEIETQLAQQAQNIAKATQLLQQQKDVKTLALQQETQALQLEQDHANQKKAEVECGSSHEPETDLLISPERTQEFLEATYHSKPEFHNQYSSAELELFRNDCALALEQTQQENYFQYECAHNLTPQAQGFLLSQNIDTDLYKKLLGTTLQHALFAKSCELFDQTALAYKNSKQGLSLLDQAVLFTMASVDANRSELICPAQMSDEIAIELLHAQWDINEHFMISPAAVFHGVMNSMHGLMHAMVELPKIIAGGLCIASTFLDPADPESFQYSFSLTAKQAQAEMQPIMQKAICAAVCTSVQESQKQFNLWWDNSSDGEKQQLFARLVADFTITPFLAARAIGCLSIATNKALVFAKLEECSNFIAQERNMANVFDAVAEAIDEVGTLLNSHNPHPEIITNTGVRISTKEVTLCKESEVIAQATQASEAIPRKIIAKETATHNKPPKHPTPVRSKIFTLQEVTNKVKKLGGKIPKRDNALFYNTEYWIEICMKNIRTTIDPEILKECNSMQQLIGNTEKSICIDIEHIINCTYELLEDTSGAFHTVEFKGGHFAGTMRKLEKEGLVGIRSYIEFESGCIEYQIEDLFSGQIFTHTEFPPHWNIEKIAQETKLACENAIRNGLLTKQTKKSLEIMTYDGFELRIITDPNPLVHNCAAIENTINRHVITSYPIYMVKK